MVEWDYKDHTHLAELGQPHVSTQRHQVCHAQYAILSLRNSRVPLRIEAHIEDTFARWISLHQHYIIDGDTYIRHTMPHEYNITIHQSIIRLRMKHKQKLNDIHPASPGCRPGTYPLIEEEAEEELNASKHRSRVMIIA